MLLKCFLICVFGCLSVCMLVCLLVCLSVLLSVCLFICLLWFQVFKYNALQLKINILLRIFICQKYINIFGVELTSKNYCSCRYSSNVLHSFATNVLTCRNCRFPRQHTRKKRLSSDRNMFVKIVIILLFTTLFNTLYNSSG